jgi:hypothetical protein
MTSGTTRIIDGKTYYVYHPFSTRERANLEAKRMRKNGYLARVIDTQSWYVVYVRRK